MLLTKAKTSKVPISRERAGVCLATILSRLVNPHELQRLLDQALGEATLGLCEAGVVEGRPCIHVRHALEIERLEDPIASFVRVASCILGAAPS